MWIILTWLMWMITSDAIDKKPINTEYIMKGDYFLWKMYFWNLATFMAILQSCNASEPINSFNDDILDMSNANIEKKTSLLDTDFYCTLNNSNAHEWYNWIKNHPNYFGHLSSLTVFQGKHFVVIGQNACIKILNV